MAKTPAPAPATHTWRVEKRTPDYSGPKTPGKPRPMLAWWTLEDSVGPELRARMKLEHWKGVALKHGEDAQFRLMCGDTVISTEAVNGRLEEERRRRARTGR